MRLFFYLSSLCCLLWSTSGYAANPIVIIDQHHSVYNIPANARVIELDIVQQLHQELFANLPNDPKQAEQIARSRLTTSEDQLKQTMRLALQDVVDAWSLGVTKVPAVVIGNYVVYGEADVNQAISQITAYQEENNEKRKLLDEK